MNTNSYVYKYFYIYIIYHLKRPEVTQLLVSFQDEFLQLNCKHVKIALWRQVPMRLIHCIKALAYKLLMNKTLRM